MPANTSFLHEKWFPVLYMHVWKTAKALDVCEQIIKCLYTLPTIDLCLFCNFCIVLREGQKSKLNCSHCQLSTFSASAFIVKKYLCPLVCSQLNNKPQTCRMFQKWRDGARWGERERRRIWITIQMMIIVYKQGPKGS